MKIIVGHTNMDLDCIGSIVLAKYLYPDHLPVRSHLIQPAARKLLNLYAYHLVFHGAEELKGQEIEHMVVVDARSRDRISEYVPIGAQPGIETEVFDHHPDEGDDIPGARIHECGFGANSTQLCLLLEERKMAIDPEDATIALTGIYSDTGNFTHTNVHAEDFKAAAYLLDQGASLKLIKDFLVPLKEHQQVLLFHDVLNCVETRNIRGHVVQSSYMELEEDSQGLGAVVERVFEVENGEVFLGFFFFKPKKKMLIIGRNSSSDVRINEILADFGGGGHAQAASATVRTDSGREFYSGFFPYLEGALRPAATAWDIMTEDVRVLPLETSLLEASLFLERIMHTGAPVVDGEERLVGFISLRDIMKGRKGGAMNAPVKGYMSKPVISAPPDITVREIDEILFRNNVGHLPITVDGKIVGIVTRSDFLAYRRNELRKKDLLLQGLGAAIDG